MTNIPNSMLNIFNQGDLLKIETDNYSFFFTFGTTYSSVPVNQNVGFPDETGRLLLAVDFGSIRERYNLSAGTNIKISKYSVKIGILKYNESAVVNDIVEEMKTELGNLGFSVGKNIIYIEKNAQGNISNLTGLVNELLNDNIDIIVPVSTPASQAAVNLVPVSIPIIFTYVTDPESAGILDKRKGVCGLSDATNFKDYLDFVKRVLPSLKTAGRIYNPSESNSLYAQNQLESQKNFYGYNFQIATVGSTSDINNAYNLIKDKNIEAILIVADNTMSLGMAQLVSLANQDKIPVIGDSYEHSEHGALAAISVDYSELAKATGDFVSSVIRGVEPESIGVKRLSTNVISVNKKTAKDINFTLPDDLIKDAKFIYE
jgi:putative tryptophan/tyrosine transport system substrate-binding protein